MAIVLTSILVSTKKELNNLQRKIEKIADKTPKNKVICILSLALVWGGLFFAQAQDAIPLNNLSNVSPLSAQKIEVLAKNTPVNELSKQHFIPLSEFAKPLATEQVYWLKITLPLMPSPYYLSLSNWSYIELYELNKGTQQLSQRGQSGHFLPVSARVYPRSEFLGILAAHPATQKTFFLKLRQEMAFYLPDTFVVSLWSEKQVAKRERDRLFYQGIFLGIIFVMALYNFLIFLTVRDISFLYYVFSIVGVGLYFMFYEGFLLEILWTGCPVFNAYSFAFIVPLTRMAWILFTQSYLHLGQILPRWNKFLNFLLLLYSIPIFTGLLSWLTPLDFSRLTVNWIGTMGVIVLSMMLAMGYLAWKKGFAPARYFLLANVLFSFGSILFILRETDWIANTLLTRYSVQFGVILQVILFSLGLADRLKKAREEVAQKELEKEKLARDQQKEKQKLIEAQKISLEQEVALQTADLKDKTLELETIIDQLRHSEQKLKTLNDLKDKFFSIISHDLKSPIATLHSFLNILINYSDKISPDEFQKLASKTQTSVESLSLLLDNLLQWAMSQMEQIQFQPTSVAIESIIQDNIDLLTVSAESKQISIQTDFPPQLTLTVDKNMFSFVLRNLLNNALKFTPKGGKIKLTVRKNAENVIFKIIDDGVGIEASQLKRLFAEQQIFTTKGTAGEKGTGLGLLLCKEFIEKNGGTLSVESQLGKGTSFIVCLPVCANLGG